MKRARGPTMEKVGDRAARAEAAVSVEVAVGVGVGVGEAGINRRALNP